MLTKVMAAFDKKARTYLTPFFVAHEDIAVRALSNAVNGGGQEPIARNPEDFSLWLLGTFDDDSAKFSLTATPVHVVEAVALKNRVAGRADTARSASLESSAASAAITVVNSEGETSV